MFTLQITVVNADKLAATAAAVIGTGEISTNRA